MVLSLQSNLAKTVWSVVIFAVLFSRAVPCSAQAVLEPRHFDISAGGRFAPFHPIFVHNHIDRSLTRQTGMFNYAAGLDLTGTYQIDKRLSVSAVLPVAFNTLSLFLPTRPLPGGRNTFTAAGIADTTVVGNCWLLDPDKSRRQNVQLGVGIKIPTGNWDTKGTFATVNGFERTRKAVPPGDQLGDGGVGILVQASGYKVLSVPIAGNAISASASYMINPRNTNGTASIPQTFGLGNTRGEQNALTLSSPDSWLLRTAYMSPMPFSEKYKLLKKLSFFVAGRFEGVPQKDLIGRSDGYRQPYFMLSTEPGLTFTHGHTSLTFSTAIFWERNVMSNLAQPPGAALRTGAQLQPFQIQLRLERRF